MHDIAVYMRVPNVDWGGGVGNILLGPFVWGRNKIYY